MSTDHMVYVVSNLNKQTKSISTGAPHSGLDSVSEAGSENELTPVRLKKRRCF
jgi:hypothetical protein